MAFLTSLRLDGFLSFAPGSESIQLAPLNVLIGPNGSGKTNLVEAIDLLRAAPTAFANAIRDGGGAQEWLWKGDGGNGSAIIDVLLDRSDVAPEMRYRIAFKDSANRTVVTDEVLENAHKVQSAEEDVFFYYRYKCGHPTINVREDGCTRTQHHINPQKLMPGESIFSQRKAPDLYPELTWVGQQFSRIQTFREWTFGRYTALRKFQRADMPTDVLLTDASNLALVLNNLELSNAWPEFNHLMKRFLPRYQRFSVKVYGGGVQFFLHEDGLRQPVPATRLSDGTIRFMALLAVLLSPNPPPLVCIEEPELGLHPDALLLLGEVLIQASSRTQLVVTTHSDTLVSALTEHADSVLVCEHIGQTKVRRVEADKLRHWLEKYRLGEIWRMGKLGGNP